MKRIIFILVIILLCKNMKAQCPNGDIILNTQQQIDNFMSTYPNCTELMGDLKINNQINTPINNLNGLLSITSISGGLFIINNNSLTTLTGLNNLNSIGGYLWISDNGLITLEGLNSLNFVGGDIRIRYNSNLTTLTALNNLNFIGDELEILANGSLTTLANLGNIDNIRKLRISSNPNLTTLSGLENLSSIERSLKIELNALTTLSGLENLSSVGGDLEIYDNYALTSLSGLDNLSSIGEALRIVDNNNLTSLVSLQNITTIGHGLLIGSNYNLTNLIGLENVNTVKSLTIISNPNLIDLTGLQNINTVESSVVISSNDSLTELTGLDNLSSIGGTLRIINNNSLTSLVGLQNITTIEYGLLIDSNYNLTNLTGLENVNTVKSLTIISNPSLMDLTGLQNINTVESGVVISSNDSLTELTGLDNLNSVYDIRVEYNDALVTLAGLGGLSNIGGILNIKNNQNLSLCNVSSICNHLIEGGMANIENNAFGCNDVVEVFSFCGSISFVEVQTFYDINQNEVQDSNEPNLDVAVNIAPLNATYYVNNNSIYFVPGSYTISLDQANFDNWTLTTNPAIYSVMLEVSEYDTIAFGLFPNELITDLQSSTISPPARCNEFVTFDIGTKNLGTTTASGTFWLEVDENILATNFIDLPDTTVAPNRYGWFFEDLFPSQSLTRQIELQIPGPPDFPVGDYLFFDAYADFEDENGGQSSQTFTYEAEVRCSYDPNDKLVNPAREGDYTLFDENLIYTIRFQNTGNDVAYDVVIQDTLDANLELESFNVLGSSHSDKLQTSMTTDGMLTFEFRDIFLPDSTSNFEGSQGYVTYMISAIDGLAENTPINNSAGIYFDLNPPIITNTTQNVMVSELPVVSTVEPDGLPEFTILPNPSTGVFEVKGIPQDKYQIHDTAGRIIQNGSIGNDFLIDISQEAQGVYIISIQIDNEVITKRIIKL